MSEQGTTKKVSLDDLRQAIAAVPEFPHAELPVSYLKLQALAGEYHAKRADAWRAAFEWLHHGEGVARCGDAYVVGLMLIEEKLR